MAEPIEDGGPAFPRQTDVVRGAEGTQSAENGMALRDYFAAKALAGLLARESEGRHIADVARHAYQAADYMLTARKKSQ